MLDNSDFQDTDIPFEVPLPDHQHVKVSEDMNFIDLTDMSHFAYACKMRYPLNLVLESWEYLWFY